MSQTTRIFTTVSVLAALTLTGCTKDDVATPSPTPATSEHEVAELADFYGQTITWETCLDQQEFQCGTVEVPMDYGNPQDQSIEIHLTRSEETGDQVPVLFNPGGPGASGISFVQNDLSFMLSDRLADNISAVGFDPRGVGLSEPVTCQTGDEIDTARETVFDTSTPEGWASSIEYTQDLAEQCIERSGDIVGFVDTVSAARDMDIIRSALGLEKLHYFGISYGTKLGATYAELFPKQVGKFVLDSVLAPSTESFEITKSQAAGFQQSLEDWAHWCATAEECRVGTYGDADSVLDEVAGLITQVQDEPLTYPNGRTQPVADLTYGMVVPLYNRDNWGYLAAAMEQALENDFEHSDYEPLFLFLADAYHGRDPNGEYTNNMDAFRAINCLDYDADEKTLEQATTEAQEIAAISPVFAPILSYSTGCNGWPFDPVDPINQPTAAGSDPIVITNLTSDPATPIHASHQLAQDLENSVHITVEGDGHGAYSRQNECIVQAIDGYLLDDVLPEDGLVCE